MFGTEAIIPVEIELPSLRIKEYNEDTNSEQFRANLDLLEKNRKRVAMKIASYHERVARYYNTQVKARSLKQQPSAAIG